MSERTLATYGRYGQRVRVYRDTVKEAIVVSWRDHGTKRYRVFAATKAGRAEADAWASAFAAARASQTSPRTPLRTDELWRRYVDGAMPDHRPKTRVLYTDAWRKWQVFVGPESIAEDLGPETMLQFRRALERTQLAPNTIARTLQVVKTVYAWGRQYRHLARNEVRDYRWTLAKDKRPPQIPEYTAEEFAALCGALPLDQAATWRAGGVLRLCGLQGGRPRAVLHLRWEDVDLATDRLRWRPEWDKLGRDETSPLRPAARAVLEALTRWRTESPWLFPRAQRRGREETYHLTSFIRAVHEAERRAGVRRVRHRAGHSLRRKAFNDVLHITGDLASAMAAIRDTSLQVASRYLRTREEQLRAAYAQMDGADRSPTEMPPDGVSRATPVWGSGGDATG